jgi:hypothetical protein
VLDWSRADLQAVNDVLTHYRAGVCENRTRGRLNSGCRNRTRTGRGTVPVPCSVIVSANVARLKEAIESLLQPSPGGTGT